MKFQKINLFKFLIGLFLLFGFFTKFSISSCCCDCCCGCCCCCGCGCCCGCCGGGSGGGCCGNNKLSIGNTDLSIGGQAQPQPNIIQESPSSVLGPDLLPDGSTGRVNQQQHEIENLFGNNNSFKRRKRGRRIVEKLENNKYLFLNNYLKKRKKRQMPYGTIKQKYLPSDWSPDNIKINKGLTSIGPGLLPDGSIINNNNNNQQNLMENNFFGFDENNNNQQNNNNYWQRRKKRQQINLLDGQQKTWFGCWPPGTLFTCQLLLARKKRNENKNNIFKLGLIPLNNIKQQNNNNNSTTSTTTFLNFLFGFLPEENFKNNKRKIKREKFF